MTDARHATVTDNLETLTTEQLLELQKKVNDLVVKRSKEPESESTSAKLKLITLSYAPRFHVPREPDPKKRAAKLLWYVKQADYDGICKMMQENPAYMFLEVFDVGGYKTTPLKKAIINLDHAIYGAFYKLVKGPLLREFIAQVFEQTVHLDFEQCKTLPKMIRLRDEFVDDYYAYVNSAMDIKIVREIFYDRSYSSHYDESIFQLKEFRKTLQEDADYYDIEDRNDLASVAGLSYSPHEW